MCYSGKLAMKRGFSGGLESGEIVKIIRGN